jgi:hypothetical protein
MRKPKLDTGAISPRPGCIDELYGYLINASPSNNSPVSVYVWAQWEDKSSWKKAERLAHKIRRLLTRKKKAPNA